MPSAREKLVAFTEATPTPTLVQAMIELDKPDAAPEEMIARAQITDTLFKRHTEADLVMDAFFSDESPEGIFFLTEHSYVELALLALGTAGVIEV